MLPEKCNEFIFCILKKDDLAWYLYYDFFLYNTFLNLVFWYSTAYLCLEFQNYPKLCEYAFLSEPTKIALKKSLWSRENAFQHLDE